MTYNTEHNYTEQTVSGMVLREQMSQLLAQTTVETVNKQRRSLMEKKLQELQLSASEFSAAEGSQSTRTQVTTDEVAQVLSPKDNSEQLDHQHKKYLQTKLPSQCFVILIFSLSSMLLPFCIDMYLSAFPAIASEYNVPVQRIEFSLSIYFIGIALGQILFGPLSDSIGRKMITVLAFILVAISSVIIAHIDNLFTLYSLRFIQGFFCAAILVTSTSILRDIYTTVDFVRINGIITLIFFIAPFVAPLIGSYIASNSSWHYIFYFIGVLSLISFFLFLKFIPETINPAFKRKLDFKSTFATMGNILVDGKSLWLIILMSSASCVIFAYVSMASGVFITFYDIKPEHFPYLFMINIVTQIGFNIFNTKMVKYLAPSKLLFIGIVWTFVAGIYCVLNSFFQLGFYSILFGIMLGMSATPLIFLNSIAIYLEYHYRHSGTAASLVNISRWILPGVVTAAAQQIDPHRGYTMLMLMGIFSLFIVFSYAMFNHYVKKSNEQVKN